MQSSWITSGLPVIGKERLGFGDSAYMAEMRLTMRMGEG
jgi:hypothetical protein